MNRSIIKIENQRKEFVGHDCTSISFAIMKNCGEKYHRNASSSYHETTWGTVFGFKNLKPLVFTWGENSSYGDPFYTEITDYDSFVQIKTLQLQDVSEFQPWSQFIGSQLNSIDLLTYKTNYPSNINTGWYQVLWAIELQFAVGDILVGALHHGDFESYKSAADEMVTICDPELIKRVKLSRRNQTVEWMSSRK